MGGWLTDWPLIHSQAHRRTHKHTGSMNKATYEYTSIQCNLSKLQKQHAMGTWLYSVAGVCAYNNTCFFCYIVKSKECVYMDVFTFYFSSAGEFVYTVSRQVRCFAMLLLKWHVHIKHTTHVCSNVHIRTPICMYIKAYHTVSDALSTVCTIQWHHWNKYVCKMRTGNMFYSCVK